MISVWSASDARALREAMRMSIDDFAAHLGVSRRGVASWSKRPPGSRLRWDMQRKLDEALAAAPAAVRDRFKTAAAQAANQQAAHAAQGTAERESAAQTAAARASRQQADTAHATQGTAGRGATALAQSFGAATDSGPEGAVAVLSGLLLAPAPAPVSGPAPALIRLEQWVARVRMGFQRARYAAVVAELPPLVWALAAARADPQTRFPCRIGRLAASAHQVAAGLLCKLGDLPLAMLAAERSAREAEVSEDPLVIAASARAGVAVLTGSGHIDHALRRAIEAAERVRHATGLDGPRPLSAHGDLLLHAAVAAACAGDRADATRLLNEAAQAAETLGREGNFGWTGFGPSNVELHRLAVALELGDAAMALQIAAAIDPAPIAQAERLATLHLDMARAFQAAAQPGAAVSALGRAYTIAPEEVRMSPRNRRLATELAQQTCGATRAHAARFVT